MNRYQTSAIIVLVASVVVVSSVMALLTTQKTIPGTGSLQTVGVGVYWNPGCTNATSSLGFGLMAPGSSKNFTLYLKNTGNSAVTLSMISRNWNPTEASSYMSLTWDREGTRIDPDQVIPIIIKLSVTTNAQGINSFSFEIVISGTG